MIDIYADESCQNGHRFLALGCTIVPSDHVAHVRSALRDFRAAENLGAELKWTKVSRSKRDSYKRLVDLYFGFIRDGVVQFHCLMAECAKIDHRRFSGGDSEIGFNKFIYQLLVKAAVRNGHRIPCYVYLDQRTTKHGLSELQAVLNNGYSAESHTPHRPFHRVHFRESKHCDLLQVNDVVLGAVAAWKNGHIASDQCATHKREVAEHIRVHAAVQCLGRNTRFARNDFRIWNIDLR